jgi:hypothetical protein
MINSTINAMNNMNEEGEGGYFNQMFVIEESNAEFNNISVYNGSS